MALKSEYAKGIGTVLTKVGTTVPAGQVRTLIGVRVGNQLLGQPITAEVYIRRAGTDIPVVPGALIPAGGAIEALASSKMVMIAGDEMYAKSNAATSLTVFPSFDEDAA